MCCTYTLDMWSVDHGGWWQVGGKIHHSATIKICLEHIYPKKELIKFGQSI
jgi:hypothetical protein